MVLWQYACLTHPVTFKWNTKTQKLIIIVGRNQQAVEPH